MAENFSDLLWMPHAQHKISLLSDPTYHGLDVRHHRAVIPYHNLCEPYLRRLGLYQVSRMKEINIDKGLLAGLIERWRPETHTFHLPVGEMTVTLQDVSCLWGLPIKGAPVTGLADVKAAELVERLLGVGLAALLLKRKKRTGPNEEVVHTISGYSIELKELRNQFAIMPNEQQGEPTEEQVRQYTRAYILDLFGTMLYADSSGDSVPAMYLQFLENLNSPIQYNWGGAVLAVLYRNLCNAVERKTRTVWGPTLLLQHWCWTRLPTGRPLMRDGWTPKWGDPNPEMGPAIGEQWCWFKDYRQAHGRAGVGYFRSTLQDLEDYMVRWEPYNDMLHENPSRLPSRIYNESDVWLACVPLIHFWMVEYHYPNRVMRQFGYSQVIPPPEPLLQEMEVRRLHNISHNVNNVRTNWAIEHQPYIERASNPAGNFAEITGIWTDDQLFPYRTWFQRDCMFNIFLNRRFIQGVDNPMPEYRDEHGVVGYIPSAPRSTRVGLRGIKLNAVGIALGKSTSNTYKAIGKFLLKMSCGLLRDNGMETKYQNMVRAANLPENPDDIEVGDIPPGQEPIPPLPQDDDPHYQENWINSENGLMDYLGQVTNMPPQDNIPQGESGPTQVFQGVEQLVWNPDYGGFFDDSSYQQATTGAGPSQVYQGPENTMPWIPPEAQGDAGSSQVYQGPENTMPWIPPVLTGTQGGAGSSHTYQGFETLVTPRTQMMEEIFSPPIYTPAFVQEAQVIAAPSQAPVEDVTEEQDNIESSQVVTPCVEKSYNNVYVRRKKANKQQAIPERRYPQREHRAPDLFTFD